MSRLLLATLLSFVSLAAYGKGVSAIPIEKMQAQLKQTVSIVFDDQSESLYGDLLDNKLHIDKICEVLKRLGGNKPRSIFIDVDITKDLKSAECIARVAEELGLKLTIDFDSNLLSAKTRQNLSSMSIGSALVATKVIKGHEHKAPKPEGGNWHNPKTRISLVKPAVMPYRLPAYFINLINGVDDKTLNKINFNWSRSVTLTMFSEAMTPKVSFQDILAGKTDLIKNKYVFIGVDQDKYDSMSNRHGEIVNGVFLHQQFTAAYLALIAEDLKPSKGSMIIFGKLPEELEKL